MDNLAMQATHVGQPLELRIAQVGDSAVLSFWDESLVLDAGAADALWSWLDSSEESASVACVEPNTWLKCKYLALEDNMQLSTLTFVSADYRHVDIHVGDDELLKLNDWLTDFVASVTPTEGGE